LYNFARRGAKAAKGEIYTNKILCVLRVFARVILNPFFHHAHFCDMDVAGTKHTRFGLPYKLLHQNEIVPFFMDEKRNVRILFILFARIVLKFSQNKLFFSLKIIKTMTRATIIKVEAYCDCEFFAFWF